MNFKEFFILGVLALVMSVLFFSFTSSYISNSSDYRLDIFAEGSGDSSSSDNYSNHLILGLISGTSSSENYSNSLGFFYGSYTNQFPENPSVIINSTDNKTSSNLNCFSVVSDPDGDLLNAEVNWYKNGVKNISLNYTSIENGSLFNSTLLSGNTSKGENWSCSIRLNDGISYSGFGNSTNLSILNSAPIVVLSSPENNKVITNRTFLFEWTGSDADEDVLTYEFNLSLAGGLGICSDFKNSENTSEENYLSTLKCLSDNNYYYIWSVRVYDGESSYLSEKRNLSLQAVLNISLNVSVIDFGFKNLSNYPVFEGNTSTGTPNPFVIQNDGNSLVNVSINATSLWETFPEESEYYQFKISNHTNHEGAFNWLSSLISWTQMKITGQVVAISELNYSEKNRANTDIYIKVPPNEPPGTRDSSVYFVSSLAE